MLTFYDFDVGGAPVPADISFAVQDMVTGTTTGNVDYTSASITGLTPAAILAIGGDQTIAAEPGEAPAAQVSAAMVAASGGGQGFRAFNRDNGTSTLGRAGIAATATFWSTNQTASGFDFTGTLSPISGGARVNYSVANVSQRTFYIAFAGANVSAYTPATALDLGSAAGTTTVSTVGFEADVVICFLPGPTGTGSSYNGYAPNIGIIVNEGGGTVVQKTIATFEANAIADSNIYQAIIDGKCASFLNSTGDVAFDITAGNFTSSGFDLVSSASASNRDILYMALKFTGGRVKLVDFTTPTSTGNASITGAGFTPRLALLFLTNLEATNPSFPLTASDLMSGLSICAIGEDEQWSMANRVDNLAATTDTACRISNTALLGANATSTNAIEATFVSFDSDGMTLNYSAVQGAGKKGFILFIE